MQTEITEKTVNLDMQNRRWSKEQMFKIFKEAKAEGVPSVKLMRPFQCFGLESGRINPSGVQRLSECHVL